MFNRIAVIIVLLSCAAVNTVEAQKIGSAGGRGTIERPGPGSESQFMDFSPRYSYAYSEGSGSKKFTWIVLTDKEPRVRNLLAATDRAEARRLWCEKEKASFVAVKLDSEWKVDLYFLCPANGSVNTEMLSTWNGLDSVVVRFDVRSDKKLKGTLRTGVGSCPGKGDGQQVYCKSTGDYTFDSPLF